MFLIPQCLTVQSTASKVSRNSSTPAHNTGHAVATLTKTQQLVCSRGRMGMRMQTASGHMLLRGIMSKPPLVRDDAAPDQGHERGSSAIDAPNSCLNMPRGHCKNNIDEPKSNPTAEQPLTKRPFVEWF
jgi:hypothetical protein